MNMGEYRGIQLDVSDRSGLLGVALLVLGYAVGFIVLHEIGVRWATQHFYSLWFPAAGLRFALLWRYGAWLALPCALAELAAQAALGRVDLTTLSGLLFAGSIVGPPLAYGVAIGLVRRRSASLRPALQNSPLTLALAAVAAPVAASLASLPWHMLRGARDDITGYAEAISTIVVFTLGDLLGVLVLAPPLLWLLSGDRGFRPRYWRRWGESLALMALCTAVVAGLYAVHGLHLMPFILAVMWIGLRSGRRAAWAAIAIICLVVLSLPPSVVPQDRQLAVHMALAAIAVAGYLAGSYADTETRLQLDVRRRDRLLLQAERLKTLRAMSVAIIHEISQPLSTLSIETRHLARLSEAEQPDREELTAAACLVERKVTHLEDMVRRLRHFGGRASQEPAPIDADGLVSEAIDVVAPAARSARVALEVRGERGLAVWGQGVELQQALVNLLRNAIAASPGREVIISTSILDDGMIGIEVANGLSIEKEQSSGMGVGLLVTRAIAEAYGGRLIGRSDKGERAFSLILQDGRTAAMGNAFG